MRWCRCQMCDLLGIKSTHENFEDINRCETCKAHTIAVVVPQLNVYIQSLVLVLVIRILYLSSISVSRRVRRALLESHARIDLNNKNVNTVKFK